MLPAEPLSWTGNISAAKTGCFRSNYRLRQRDNKPTWTLEHEHPCLLASASCLHTLCHSRIMHSRLLLLPPSVLRSVQHSPPSPDCCCLPTAVEIKGGGMEEHKIFSKSSNYCCTAVVKTESAPPATPLAGLPLSLDCTVVLLCTATLSGFITGLWQILDSNSQWHPNMQLILIHSYSVLWMEKQFSVRETISNPRWSIPDSAISIANIKVSFNGHHHSKEILSHKRDTKVALRFCQCWPPNSQILPFNSK